MRGKITHKTKRLRKSSIVRASSLRAPGRIWEGSDEGELLRARLPRDARDANQLEEIINRAVQLIDPIDSQKTECRKHVELAILRVRQIACWRASRTPNSFEKLTVALEKATEAFNKFFKTPDCAQSICINVQEVGAFFKIPELILKVLRSRKKHVPKKGGPIADGAKRIAAWNSFALIQGLGKKRATKTIGGSFYELASVLYEGATYTAHENLERHCRKVFEAQDLPTAEDMLTDALR
jgi:hypothetical protein